MSPNAQLKFPLFLSIAPKLQLFRPYCSRYALPLRSHQAGVSLNFLFFSRQLEEVHLRGSSAQMKSGAGASSAF